MKGQYRRYAQIASDRVVERGAGEARGDAVALVSGSTSVWVKITRPGLVRYSAKADDLVAVAWPPSGWRLRCRDLHWPKRILDAETMAHDEARSPRATPEARDAFRALVPDDERVLVRPMFGSVAAFVGGNMFMGLVKDELYRARRRS